MWMWAGHTIAARLSVGEMSPMVMMGLRWFACLAILAFIFRHRLAAEWPRVRRVLAGWRHGRAWHGRVHLFFILAAQYTTAVNLGITQSSVPMIVMVLSLVFLARGSAASRLSDCLCPSWASSSLVTGGSAEILMNLEFNAVIC